MRRLVLVFVVSTVYVCVLVRMFMFAGYALSENRNCNISLVRVSSLCFFRFLASLLNLFFVCPGTQKQVFVVYSR
jgi:hypothetical protein